MKPIAILYEHPAWFAPLFRELERRDLPHELLDASAHSYDPHETESPFSLGFNRASPSAFLRGHPGALAFPLFWLEHLARLGVPTFNGPAAWALELSKASQLGLLAELGLRFPRSRVINAPSRALEAARGLRFPVVVKPNVGGSGAGITRYDSEPELSDAVRRDAVSLGVDGTALVQELAPLRGGHITRVEVLEGRALYAIRVFPAGGSFNLCPADICRTVDGQDLTRTACLTDTEENGMRVEGIDPDPGVVREVEQIAARAQLDVGGIEYLVDDRDGERYYYDINALSNFVADPVRVVGFDPFSRLVDALERRVHGPLAAQGVA